VSLLFPPRYHHQRAFATDWHNERALIGFMIDAYAYGYAYSSAFDPEKKLRAWVTRKNGAIKPYSDVPAIRRAIEASPVRVGVDYVHLDDLDRAILEALGDVMFTLFQTTADDFDRPTRMRFVSKIAFWRTIDMGFDPKAISQEGRNAIAAAIIGLDQEPGCLERLREAMRNVMYGEVEVIPA
jgi:hypothetical protein